MSEPFEVLVGAAEMLGVDDLSDVRTIQVEGHGDKIKVWVEVYVRPWRFDDDDNAVTFWRHVTTFDRGSDRPTTVTDYEPSGG